MVLAERLEALRMLWDPSSIAVSVLRFDETESESIAKRNESLRGANDRRFLRAPRSTAPEAREATAARLRAVSSTRRASSPGIPRPKDEDEDGERFRPRPCRY